MKRQMNIIGSFFRTWFLPSPAHDAFMPPTGAPSDRIMQGETVGNAQEDELPPEGTADDDSDSQIRRQSIRAPSESTAVDSSTFRDLVHEPEASEERLSRVRNFDEETGAE